MSLNKVNQTNLIKILHTSYIGSYKLSSRDKMVLIAVFSFADYGDNGFFGKAETLEPQVGSSAILIEKSLKKLEKIGALIRTSKKGLIVNL